jgi:hypothetical protein
MSRMARSSVQSAGREYRQNRHRYLRLHPHHLVKIQLPVYLHPHHKATTYRHRLLREARAISLHQSRGYWGELISIKRISTR